MDRKTIRLSYVTVVLESLSVPCVVVLMQVSWCGKEKYLLDLRLANLKTAFFQCFHVVCVLCCYSIGWLLLLLSRCLLGLVGFKLSWMGSNQCLATKIPDPEWRAGRLPLSVGGLDFRTFAANARGDG